MKITTKTEVYYKSGCKITEVPIGSIVTNANSNINSDVYIVLGKYNKMYILWKYLYGDLSSPPVLDYAINLDWDVDVVGTVVSIDLSTIMYEALPTR